MTAAIGRSVNRVDGREKVTGAARYCGEIALPGLAHAAIVGATIPSGRVTAISADDGLAAGGVVGVLTHENLPKSSARTGRPRSST
jgi:xanthine dehydrogenase YagR molybdenum-binding subunit